MTAEAPADPASRGLVLLLALSAGVTVANIYYNQPLLAAMARSFGATERETGMIPTLTQLGYGLGMLALVPLGDRYERRGLIVRMVVISVAVLVLLAFAPSLPLLAAASLALGVASMVPQYIVPYAAGAAAPEERGRVVGTVMSGLLIGILLSRTVSGFVSEHLGWRAMYLIAAAANGGLALVLRIKLPRQPPAQEVSLGELYLSLVRLARTEPILRLHATLGALTFAAFSAFWSTLAFHLAAPPLSYGSAVAGSFGVIGVVGAVAAPLVGRFADNRDPAIITIVALVAVGLSFVLFGALGHSLIGLGLGVILLDLGVQAGQITNQTRVYALAPHMRNRLNTVYMSTYFAGGALGSLLGSVAYTTGGWTAVSWSGIALAVTALVIFLLARAVAARSPNGA
ncbi:MAG: MFS transporter [Polyangiales bacterium]